MTFELIHKPTFTNQLLAISKEQVVQILEKIEVLRDVKKLFLDRLINPRSTSHGGSRKKYKQLQKMLLLALEKNFAIY